MNRAVDQRLPEIFTLAHDKTESSRVKLAGILADVFLSDNKLSDREQLLVNEIIDELLSNTTTEVRKMLAERLAHSDQVPHRVLLNLACDQNLEVARPVLVQNAHLKDEDLIFVLEAHGKDHALAVASRRAIEEAVVDALVATGDIEVMEAVAENLGAKISSRAMHVMIEAARFGHKLHEPLVKRHELTADMGLHLYWWINSELRRVIMKRFGVSKGQVDQSLESAITDLLTSVEQDNHDTFAMQKVADWLKERECVNAKVMIQCLRMGFFKLFNILVCMKSGLDANLVEMMVAEDGGRSVSVLCRAMEFDKPSFVSIFLLSRGARPGEQIVNPKELSAALQAYERLDARTARGLIEGWKKDPSYLMGRLKQPAHQAASH
jgi:uncharacterized protein (DUF2336 family)